MFGLGKRRQERLEAERKEQERLRFEKEFKEKNLINRALRNLQMAVDKYEQQKTEIIAMARMAEKNGLKNQYAQAANALKIIINQQDAARAKYLSISIANLMKNNAETTKDFVEGMATVAKQLTEINSNIDFMQAQQDYEIAMREASMMEEKMNTFMDTVNDSVGQYADAGISNPRVDQAIDALIHAETASTAETAKKDDLIDSRLQELDSLMKSNK